MMSEAMIGGTIKYSMVIGKNNLPRVHVIINIDNKGLLKSELLFGSSDDELDANLNVNLDGVSSTAQKTFGDVETARSWAETIKSNLRKAYVDYLNQLDAIVLPENEEFSFGPEPSKV